MSKVKSCAMVVAVALTALSVTLLPAARTRAASTTDRVAPSIATQHGVSLLSVACYPQRKFVIPKGLPRAEWGSYVPPASAVETIPCAHPTGLTEVRPVGLALDGEDARFQAAQGAYGAALDRGAAVADALVAARDAFDAAPSTAATPSVGADNTVHPLCSGNIYSLTGTKAGPSPARINYGFYYTITTGCQTEAIEYDDAIASAPVDYSNFPGHNVWYISANGYNDDSTTVQACATPVFNTGGNYSSHSFSGIALPGGTRYFSAWYVPSCPGGTGPTEWGNSLSF